MKRPTALLLSAIMLTTSAFGAEDHLVPENSAYLGTQRAAFDLGTARLFEPVIDRNAEAWVFELGGLAPTEVLGVKKRNGSHLLFLATDISEPGPTPGINSKPKLRTREVPISASLAQKIIGVWRKMLRQTAYALPTEFAPPDSGSLVFAMSVDPDWISGRMPYSHTPKLSRLAEAVESMRQVCDGSGPKDLSVLERNVDALLKMP